MVLIYDEDGQVAGMQSGMPASEFEGGVCPDSGYYQQDTLAGTEVSHTGFIFERFSRASVTFE